MGVRQLPVLRAHCVNGPRPCPFVTCRHHLYLDVLPSGTVKLNFPDLEPWQMSPSCALDVAEDGDEKTLQDVGRLMNVTRERARQMLDQSLRKLMWVLRNASSID